MLSVKSDFKLNNVCGTVYSQGNVCFSADGKSILTPTGNRVSRHNLVNGECTTFPWSSYFNITCFDVSSDGLLLLAVDEKGIGRFANLKADLGLESVLFRHHVTCVKFSHAGTTVAVGSVGEVQIWSVPVDGILRHKSVVMLTRYRDVLKGDVLSLEWAHDDSHVLVSGADSTVRVLPNRRVWDQDTKLNCYGTLATQRTSVFGAFFASANSETIISVSADRNVVKWGLSSTPRLQLIKLRRKIREGVDDDDEDAILEDEDNMEYVPESHLRLSGYSWDKQWSEFLDASARITCATYGVSRFLLVCGFADGTFTVSVTEPSLSPLHTLSITAQQISSVSLNNTADWIAFGSTKLHQLLVWEWKSETYILRHQSHHSDINTVCYSSDGQYVVSGGDDAKVKVWRVSTGQCVATFKDHQGSISACIPNYANAIYTASADGTIRAFDLQRLKSFRTMTPPRPSQFTALALDPSGDLLAAGSMDGGSIYLFATQTGKYIDEFIGHTSMVSALSFHPAGTFLASVSWDCTCRVYDVFGVDDSTGDRIRGSVDSYQLGSEGVCVHFSPDGKSFATLSYNSEITVYDCQNNSVEVKTSWNVERDTAGGWLAQGPNPKANNSKRPFTTMAFSPDSATLLVAGESKWIALYSAAGGFLLRKWAVTDNRSVDGLSEFYNWRKDTDAGDVTKIDDDESDEEDKYRKVIKLPGVTKGVHAVGKRSTRVTARTKALWFSPGGREWAAATSCGILVYSLDAGSAPPPFVPAHLAKNVTPSEVETFLRKGSVLEALLCALQLNLPELVDRVMLRTPLVKVDVVVAGTPNSLVTGLMEATARLLAKDTRWELHSAWCKSLLQHHGRNLMKSHDPVITPHVKELHKSSGFHSDVVKIVDENTNTLEFLVGLQ
eukprot:PhF_6_TR11568/c0_g1_i1/m.18657/K14558/PWP2, UTP1; periodic tryptophan protein 2